MRPIDKTSEDLFQKLRSRFSPISMGDENAEETADPAEARIFNFMYKEGDNEIGYVSISIIDNRSFKVYFGTDIIDNMEVKTDWYAFLRDLRMFAKRNLMSFDARDLAKNQLEPRDFKFISKQDGTYKDHEVAVSESVMFGSRRKSYQTTESAKLIVNHRKSVDETKPGARSRYIESIYIENAEGERYKFPYNYLTGARSMLSHVSEGGTPYDDIGKHIVGMVKEMKDLSKFARRTKKYAMEDEQAGSIRDKVVERFQNLKKQLGAISVKENYKKFVEAFKPSEDEEDDVEQLKERFTRQVFDPQLEDTLPAVNRALKEAEVNALAKETSMPKEAIAYEAWASEIVPEGKFGGEKAAYKMGLVHGSKGEKKIDAEQSFGAFAKYYYKGYDDARENMDWRLEKPRSVNNLPREFDSKVKEAKKPAATKRGETDAGTYRYDQNAIAFSNSGYRKKFTWNEIKQMLNGGTVGDFSRNKKSSYNDAYTAVLSDGDVEYHLPLHIVPGLKAPKRKSDLDKGPQTYRDYMGWGPVKKKKVKEEEIPAVEAVKKKPVDWMAVARDWGYGFRKLRDYEKPNHLVGQEAYLVTYSPDNSKWDEFDHELGDVPASEIKELVLQHAVKNEPGLLKLIAPDRLKEATPTGTVGTMGTTGTQQKPQNPGELLRDPNLQQAAKNVSKVAQAAGIKSPAPQVAQAMAAQAAGKKPTQQAMQTVGGLGNTIMQAAASDPQKAAQLQAMMKKMVVQGKFDEDAVRSILSPKLK